MHSLKKWVPIWFFWKFAWQIYNSKDTWKLVINTIMILLSANCFPSSLTSKEFRPILALLHFVQECKYFQQRRSQTNQLQTKFEKKRYSRIVLDYLLNLRWKCVLGRHWHWQDHRCIRDRHKRMNHSCSDWFYSFKLLGQNKRWYK